MKLRPEPQPIQEIIPPPPRRRKRKRPEEGIHAIAMPVLDTSKRVDVVVEHGQTIGQILGLLLPGATSEIITTRTRVHLNGNLIVPAYYGRVKPKIGTKLIIRVIPSGNAILRNVLMLAATVAAAAIGQLWVGPALAGAVNATGFAAQAISAASTAAIAFGLSALVNLIVPINNKKRDEGGQTYTLNGWQNQATPGAAIPFVAGKHRMAPPYYHPPYTEIIGDDVYVRAGFLIGYGPVKITDIKIGDTPIDKYIWSSVEYEVREGYPTDQKSSIIHQQVLQQNENLRIQFGQPETRYFPKDCTGGFIDITFPQGLYGIRTSGENANSFPIPVGFVISIRNVDTNVVTPMGMLFCMDSRQKPRAFTFPMVFPVRGKYEVTITRTVPDEADDQTGSKQTLSTRSFLTAIRGIRPEYPLNHNRDLAWIAVKIKATAQANGTLDALNCLVSMVGDKWNPATEEWEPLKETNNPAAVFRKVITGPAVAYPVPPEEAQDLEEWFEDCAGWGCTYNRLHLEQMSLGEALVDIAAAGRASPRDTGTGWGVVIDKIKTNVIAHITARNMSAFKLERGYKRFPDGHRVVFNDEENDYKQVERLIPMPGHVGPMDVVEDLSLPGKTNAGEVWRETRRRQHESKLRPDAMNMIQGVAHLQASRGDLVKVSHDVIKRVMVSSRIKKVLGANKGVVLEDPVEMEEGVDYALRFQIVPRDDSDPNAPILTIVRNVKRVVGIHNVVTFEDAVVGDLEEGDLAMFGVRGEETFDAIVAAVEGTEDLGGRITVVDHAPAIQTLTAAEVPPPWFGRGGGEIYIPPVTPQPPVITAIFSSESTEDFDTDLPNPIVVQIAPAIGERAVIKSFLIEHRLVGASSWSALVESDLYAPYVVFAGSVYANGQEIEVRAYAKSRDNLVSGASVLVTHTVGQDDFVRPVIDTFDVSYNATTGLWTFTWTLDLPDEEPEDPPVPGAEERLQYAAATIRYAPGIATDWETMTPVNTGPLLASPWTSPTPVLAPGTYTFAAEAVDTEGTVGPPKFVWLILPEPPAQFLLVDDNGDLLLDDVDDGLTEG